MMRKNECIMKERCKWKNLNKSEIYQVYHDYEWGVESHDDRYLFEMLVLESFHCGLSWLIILNKRDAFKEAFDDFDVNKICAYGDDKIEKLMQNSRIVRNRMKIVAAIENAKAFIRLQREFESFDQYIWSFTAGEVQYGRADEQENTNELSDKVSKDMKKRGFKFMGSVTTYSYLEAIGVMNHHDKSCYKYVR